jgi:hypothetical protein
MMVLMADGPVAGIAGSLKLPIMVRSSGFFKSREACGLMPVNA